MNIKLLNLIVCLGLLFNFWGGNPEPDQPTSAINSNSIDLIPTWATGIVSDGVGYANILTTDLNQDGKADIATCSRGHAYVLNLQSSGDYQPIWYSDNIDCSRIVYADRDFNGISELYVISAYTSVIIIDSADFTVVDTLPTAASDIDVADVDGDGALEIVVVSADRTVVYDAATLTVAWEALDLGGNRVEIGNIDADPLLEIVVNGSTARILNASEKMQEWTYAEGFGVEMDLGDVDGDGREEIVYIGRSGNAYVLDGESQTINWQLTGLGYLDDISTGDVDADGVSEVIIANGDYGAKISGYQGNNGTKLWTILNPNSDVFEIAVGDVDNDGVSEILWGAGHNALTGSGLIIGNWISQTVEWTNKNLDGPMSVASGDLDLDGQVEIVMASFGTNDDYRAGTVRIYDGTTHALEWSIEIDSSFYDIYQLEVSQLDLDPALEILIGGEYWYGTHLLVYDGVTRTLDWVSPVLGANAPRAVLVENIDEDALDEIIIGLSDAHVQVLDGASETIQWDSGPLGSEIVDITLGNLGLNGNSNLAILTNQSLYVYDVDTWESVANRLVGSGKHVAMIEADSNEPGQLLIIVAGVDSYTLQALEAKSLELIWQRPLGNVYVKNLFVSDLNEDAIQEFIVVGSVGKYTSDPSLLMIGSKNHPMFWKFLLKRNLDQINDVDISDIDLDGKGEMLIGSATMIQVNEIISTEMPFYTGYLPAVSKPKPSRGIYGKLMNNGAPAGNVPLHLRFYNGVGWSTYAILSTANDGSFSFTNLPNLDPGQAFYVLYQNTLKNPSHLWTWHTRLVQNYSLEQEVNLGEFDMANIPLVSPADQTMVSLPFTFQWVPRTATPSDSYEFNLFDPYDGDPYFYNDPPLGYVNGHTLSKLPPGFKVNTPYVWEVWVYGPDGGFGVSFEAYWVAFSNAGVSVTKAERPSHPKILPDMDIIR